MPDQPREARHRMPDTRNYEGKHERPGCLSGIVSMAILVVGAIVMATFEVMLFIPR